MHAKSLMWQQVNAWRLSQHCLSRRLPRPKFVDAVSRTGGIQAQVLSAAELALWARVDDLTSEDVQSALWQNRTLIKTWAMRGTLHLISARDYPLYIAARSVDDPRNWTGYFEYYGISSSELEAYLNAAADVLSSEPMTRVQLATALAETTRIPALSRLLTEKGWGTPLKPLAWRGVLCFGPNQGQNVTFVNSSQWMGAWAPADPTASLQEIARRYLRAYGPATVEEFAQWWGMRLTPARRLFKSLEDELESVDVEGWPAIALKETLEPMYHSDLPGTIHLLPLFDAYMMGIGRGADIEPLLAGIYQKKVYRPQGWVSSVVLEDGYVKGIWDYTYHPMKTIVRVHLFSTPTPSIINGIEKETERLRVFLNNKVELEFAED